MLPQNPRKVRVFLTVDTEFSIAGAFDPRSAAEPVGMPAVSLKSSNSSEGLGFILSTLQEYSLRATFFIETCNAAYFGADPMSAVISEIRGYGHDTQLHLHPCWSAFRDSQWRNHLSDGAPSDSLFRYSSDEIIQFIEEGVELFGNAGAPPPTALRAGNAHVGENVYDAMRKTNIQLGSNIALALYKSPEPAYQRYGGCIDLHGSVELPIQSYREMNIGSFGRDKTLTVIGSTFSEIKYLLNSAHNLQSMYLVLLTHPAEFALCSDQGFTQVVANYRTQRRFAEVCQFLKNNSHKFEVSTIGDALNDGLETSDDPVLTTPFRYSAERFINRMVGQ